MFDTQGHLIRTLVKDSHRRAGRNTDYWDGIDQFGNPVSPGNYVLKGLYHPPIETKPVISIDNPGTPPWPNADGTGDWLSDEAAPQAAVTDGKNVYLAAPGVMSSPVSAVARVRTTATTKISITSSKIASAGDKPKCHSHIVARTMLPNSPKNAVR